MFLSLQALVFLALVIYFAKRRQEIRRRRRKTWSSLLAQLQSGWSARELNAHFLWKEGLTTTPDDAWQRMEGPKGLWVMYQNARVMLEIADFAVSSTSQADRALIDKLRLEAVVIRLCALMGLSQYGMSQADERVRLHAYHAASGYIEMAARVTHLLQEHAATVLPDFVDAM